MGNTTACEGWRIVNVDPKGPCGKHNITNYFDFVVGIMAGDRVLDLKSHGIGTQMQEQAEKGNEIQLAIKNYKTGQTKVITIVPISKTADNDKAGCLGLTVQYNMNSTRCNKCIRVKSIDETKLSEKMKLDPVVKDRLEKGLSGDGFEAEQDFILGLADQPTVTFETQKDFRDIVMSYLKEKKSMPLNVYNDKEKKVKTIVVDPKYKVLVVDCMFDVMQIPSFPAFNEKSTMELKAFYKEQDCVVTIDKSATMKEVLKIVCDEMQMNEETANGVYCVQLTNEKSSLSVSLHPANEIDMSKLVKDFEMYKVTKMDLETDDFKIMAVFGDKKQEVGLKQSMKLKEALDTVFKAMDLEKTEMDSVDCIKLTNEKFVMSVPLDFENGQMDELIELFEMYNFGEMALQCSSALFKVMYDGKKHVIAAKQADTMRSVFKQICDTLELTSAQCENIDVLHLKNKAGTANMALYPSDADDMKKLVKDFATYKFDEIILEMKQAELNVHFGGKAQKVMVNKTVSIKEALQTIYIQIKMKKEDIPKINSLRLKNAQKSMNLKLIISDEENMNKLVQQLDAFHITDLYLEVIHVKKMGKDDEEKLDAFTV